MKKPIFTFCLAATSLLAGAQIPNSSFEQLNPTNGQIKNWGHFFMIPVTFDLNGGTHSDSIVFDQALYFSTSDAHSGTKALEMRNAFNYTTGQGIAGQARVSPNDTDYAAFFTPVSFLQQPANFTFYYKFFPAGNDTALAYMQLLDSSGNTIGEASAEISGTISSYALASVPVNYTMPGPAAFIGISFSCAKPGTQPSFGTRFLVDDVNMMTATGIASTIPGATTIRCYPNPAADKLTVALPEQAGKGTIQVTDLTGRLVQEVPLEQQPGTLSIDVSALGKGVYLARIHTTQAIYYTQFIK